MEKENDIIYVYDISTSQMKNIVKNLKWDSKRINVIKKGLTLDNQEYFAAFYKKECVAICIFYKSKGSNIFYLSQFAADKIKGIGFKTLQKAIDTKYPKVWLMAELSYDEKNDKYFENTKLCDAYRSQSYLKELKLSPKENIWKSEMSLFFTKNLSEKEVLAEFKKHFMD